MCVLYLCYEKVPSKKMMEETDIEHPDGVGVAWLEGDHIRWKKGLTTVGDTEKVIKKLSLPFMIHFRRASIGMGAKNPLMTHPFPLNEEVDLRLEGTSPAVLAHNGLWKEWHAYLTRSFLGTTLKVPRGPWSDTRALAWHVQRHGAGFLDLLALEDRVAIMDPSFISELGTPFRTFGVGWIQREGFWQSQEIKKSGTNWSYTSSPHEEWANSYKNPSGGKKGGSTGADTKSGLQIVVGSPGGSASPLAVEPPPPGAFDEALIIGMLGELRAHIGHRSGGILIS